MSVERIAGVEMNAVSDKYAGEVWQKCGNNGSCGNNLEVDMWK
jgi:hypothetical protein